MDVVKIGGSILFDQEGKFNESIISNFLRYLRGENAIVVLGCGEFLHRKILKYALTDKPCSNSAMKYDIECRYKEISKIIDCRSLKISQQLSMPYCPVNELFIKESNGRKDWNGIVGFNAERLTIPMVTGGGIVSDEINGYASISSDTVAACLARHCGADRLLIFTDVDGVWSDMSSRVLLRKLSVREVDKVDLKGGMADKIRRVKNSLTNKECEIIIANGFKEKVISDVMNGIYNKCTQILL